MRNIPVHLDRFELLLIRAEIYKYSVVLAIMYALHAEVCCVLEHTHLNSHALPNNKWFAILYLQEDRALRPGSNVLGEQR